MAHDSYEIGTSVVGLAPAASVFGLTPRSRYMPGAERKTSLSGNVVYVGYARSVWAFDYVPVETWEAAIQTTLGFSSGQYSGEVYVTTRDEFDVFGVFHALMRLPAPDALERLGYTYRGIEIEFLLLEAES